ncbi:MAG: bifunctional metallophosphatase/5'-nucleotidase [Wenzhouxiangella sp.]
MRLRFHLTFFALMATAMFGCAPAVGLTVLYFNDAHEIAPVDDGVRGGIARLAGLIEAERAGESPVLVLFGGDLAGGTLFGLMRGEPMVEAMNAIGIDAAGFGQHEFDHGVDQARRLVDLSDFPWVTANLTETDGRPFHGLDRYLLLDAGGVRVGVFGLTTAMATTRNEGRVLEQDVIASARAAVAGLERAGAQLIIALTQQPVEEDLAMVREVPGIDLVLGEEMSETVSRIDHVAGTYLARSAGNISSLIRARWLGPETTDWQLSVIPVDASAPEHPELAKMRDHYTALLEQRLAEPVLAIEQDWRLSRETARSADTRLGHLVADAYRHAMASDIGFATAGGLRADLVAEPPALTVGDVAAVLPFDNRLVRLRATGADVRTLMEQALAGHPAARNAYPLVSGLTMRFDPEAPPGARIQSLTHDGHPIASDQVLSIAVPLFLAEGGDGYTLLAGLEREQVGPLDREALAAFLARTGASGPTRPDPARVIAAPGSADLP